ASEGALVENKIQILASASLAQKVIKRLNLERDPEFNGGKQSAGLLGMILTTVGLRERAVRVVPSATEIDPIILKRFTARLSVATEGRSSALRVSFSSIDPRKAALIVNAIAEQLIADDGGTTAAGASGGNTQLAQLEERARRTAADVERYKTSTAS